MNNEPSLFLEARRYEKQGRFDLALEKYKKAISLEIGDLALGHQGKARALAQLGRLEESLIECQKALELNSELWLVHGMLGDIYRMKSRPNLAEKELLTALRLNPDDIISLGNLAGLYFDLGRYQEASDFYKKFLQLQPDNTKMQLYLIQSYINQSAFAKAITQLNSMFKKKPTMLAIYPLYSVILVNIITLYFGRLNFILRISVGTGLSMIALLAPVFLSIPIGILLTIFILLVTFANLWFGRHKGASLLILLLLLNCSYIVYWILVWLHKMWLFNNSTIQRLWI